MGLLRKKHQQHLVAAPHSRQPKNERPRLRICRFEQIEPRQLLSATVAPIHVGSVYFEDSNKYDQPSVLQGTTTQVADLLEVSFVGGAAGTQLTQVRIDANNTFFDTTSDSPGAYGHFPLAIISHEGFEITSTSVVDGGTALVLNLSGFNAGEKLVFTVDVDERGNLQPNAVVEGAEFEGATLSATFTAPHMETITASGLVFYDQFDLTGTSLANALPNDNYDNDPSLAFVPEGCSPGPVYTAGANGAVQQVPLPITLAGTVFNDPNASNTRESGEAGIAGVTLTLYELQDGQYVATGKTATTDANGNYKFEGLLPGIYRVVETQPAGYLSVGSTPGTVNGETRGLVTTVDILSSINLEGGDDSIHNDFAEVVPASVSGYVYVDANNNGVFDTGETPIAGAQLTLLDGSGTSTGKTATTDGAGFYRFDSLMPGNYGVSEAQPTGYFDGLDAAGTAGGSAQNPGDLINGLKLVGGQNGLNYNFGELLPGCISGYVYVDANNNGVFDESEAPITGVTLTLLDASGNPTGETRTTDDTGFYKFCGIAPGTYGVIEAQPGGYVDGLDTPGSAGGIAHNPGDRIDTITIPSGTKSTNNNFGELLPGSLSGYVYVDANDNGVFDQGESPIAGVTIRLLDATGKATGETRVTDETGFYRFTELAPGSYGVAEAQPDDYFDGQDAVGTTGGTAHNPGDLIDGIGIQSGDNSKYNNFGELLPASIRGQVFADLNGNNELDAGETLLNGVTLYLLDSEGNRVGSTTTNSNGKYAFTNLKPGVYGIEEIQPAGYLEGANRVGSAGGDLDGVNRILKAQLSSGADGINYDFWEVVPAKISGYVFQDGPTITVKKGEATPYIPSVRDGKLTSDDKRLAGVTLQLCDGSGYPLSDSNGNPITTVTDANGYYEFTMLRPGVYSIVETQPSGYIQGVDSVGSNGGLVVNQYASIDASVLSTLAVDPKGSAIVRITVQPGEAAVEYNFSEVLVKSEGTPGGGLTPSTPTPLLSPPVGIFGEYRHPGSPYYWMPEPARRLMAGGAGSPGGYTWHLSVIDAGQPRHELSGDEFAQAPQNAYFDPVSWSGPELNQGEWVLADEDGIPVTRLRFGMPAVTPVTGDWNGDGTTKIGVFIDGLWFLDLNGNGVWDETDLWIKLGSKGDQAVTGDWNGDGKTDIGIYGPTWIGDLKAITVEPGLPDADSRPITARPKNVPPDPSEAAVGYRTLKKGQTGKLRSDLIDHVFQYGTKGDIAVTGDWNGDGISTIGVFRNGVWFLDMDGDGRWSEGDVTVDFGQDGDRPVVGDWTGDGISKLGVFRNGKFILDTNNNRQVDAADKVFELGSPGDKPVAGDWNGDGIDTVGIYHEGTTADVPLQAANTK